MTKLLRRGSAPEHNWESAQCAGGDVVAEGVVEVFPDGWKNYPAARSPGRADAATTRGERRKPLPARHYRSKVDSTGRGVVVAGLQKSRK